jgi:ketosteroid isomerase-like protein
MPAWLRWFAPNGAQLAPGKVVRTDAERRAHMAGLFGDPTLRLVWDPDTASIAAANDLGYTIGRYQLRRLSPDGSFTVLSTGRYLTIWRKQPDGSWKAELDTGNPDPPPNAP